MLLPGSIPLLFLFLYIPYPQLVPSFFIDTICYGLKICVFPPNPYIEI